MKTFCCIFMFLLVVLQTVYCEQYRYVPCVIHVHSFYSDNGKMSIEQIAETANSKKIKAVIFADHDIMKYDYGIWPLYKIIHKQVVFDSVLRIGPGKYLSEISRVQQKFPDLLLIPGVESSPYYYWSGSALKKNLVLHDWHKHLLLAGLDKPGQYSNLPVLGNENNSGPFDFGIIFLMVLMLCAGAGLFYYKKSFGIIFMGITLVVLIEYFPYKSLPYNQYNGNQGEKPYQTVINYVNKTAPGTGMVFWAHPESPNYDKVFNTGIVSIQTRKYAESLLYTDGYTGFAYFQEGNKSVGRQGGIWDKVLNEYCNGARKSPV